MSFPEKLEWIPASDGDCPENAIQAGLDSGSEVYIVRAHLDDDLIVPGKLHLTHSCAYIPYPYNMKEVAVTEYEVLCGPPACLSWVDASGGDIPKYAVPGGEEESGETLYIGRVIHNGSVTVGKVHPSHGSCYISYGGQELAFEDYEILVKNKLGQVMEV